MSKTFNQFKLAGWGQPPFSSFASLLLNPELVFAVASKATSHLLFHLMKLKKSTCTLCTNLLMIPVCWQCLQHQKWYNLPLFCSEYMTYVMEALELEDTVRNYERRNSTGWSASLHNQVFIYIFTWFNIEWNHIMYYVTDLRIPCHYFRKFISSFRSARTGKLGSLLDTMGNIHSPICSCSFEI